MSISRHLSETLFLQGRITSLLPGIIFLSNPDSEKRIEGGDGMLTFS